MLKHGRPHLGTSDRLRLRALAAVARGPAAVVPALCVVALFVGIVGDLVLELGSAAGAHPRVNDLARWCLRGLAGAGLVGLAWDRFGRRRAGRAPTEPCDPRPRGEPAPRDLLTAAMLAAALVLVVLLVPVHYLAARTHPTTLHWNHFGFLDKRWLTSLFLCATVGSALALAVATRVVATALQRPASWRAWLAATIPAQASAELEDAASRGAARSRRWRPAALKLLCAVVVAGYFFGPPWHLAPHAIGYHEALTMGGVQAVRTGSLPYIGAAAVQYGPAAELANVAYVLGTGHLSIDGLREATLLLHLLAATLFLGVLFLRVRPLVAGVTAAAAILVFPTLQTFMVTSDGSFDGFWGWTDALRYAGLFLLAMAFPALAGSAASAPVRVRSVALGVGWGLLCLVAQENLIGGALVLGVLSVLLVVSDTVGRRPVLAVLAWIAAGVTLLAVPVCAFYALHGELGRFVELYLLVPRAVAAGYSNTRFPHRGYTLLFYGLPFLLGALLFAALLTTRPLRVATRWTDRRVVLISAITAALISHLGALTRSDAPHLVNTELALPAAICLAAFDLPVLLGARSRWSRWVGSAAIALAALALLPLTPRVLEPTLIPAKVWRPLHARLSPPAQRPLPSGIPEHSLAATRVGESTLRQRRCCKADVRMAQLVGFMNRLHMVVDGRRVLVDRTRVLTPPAVYFLADLHSAPFLQDQGTMVLNTAVRRRWLQYLRAHLPETQALVTTSTKRPAARVWLEAFPQHRTVVLPLGAARVLVLLRPARPTRRTSRSSSSTPARG